MRQSAWSVGTATPASPLRFSWLSVTLLVTTLVSPAVATNERQILMEFYQQTGGEQWLKKENWGSNSPICSWKGVSCVGGDTTGDSDVDTIQLPDNNVVGSVPASLYSMPLLRFLDLEDNPLTDAGFVGFRQAKEGSGVSVSPLETLALNGCNLQNIDGISDAPTSLRDLRLANNNLNGEFPTELFQVTSLRRMFLDQNGITGSIPTSIGLMDQLIDFHAINVPFKGQVPSEIGLLTQLVTMVLRDNDFSGTIPSELSDMEGSLEILSIGRSAEAGQGKLSGPLPSFSRMQNLELLDLSLNSLTSTIPRDFLLNSQRTDDLVIVRLDGNSLTGTLPKQLSWIDSLDLGLTDNMLVGPIPDEVCEKKQWMTGLVEEFGCAAILCPAGTASVDGKQTQTAECTPCEGDASPYLGQTSCSGGRATANPWHALPEFYQSLQGQSWDNQEGWSSIDNVLKNKKLSDLQSTDLDYCNFYGVTCDATGGVTEIVLSDNSLYGVIPASTFSLPTMTTFDVSSNRVSLDEDGLKQISDSEVLKKLVLSHTDVTTIDGLNDATSIEELYLDGISFDSTLPDALFTLKNLKIVQCPNCQLRGSIPTLIGRLTDLMSIEFRWNELSGPLPSEFGLLTNLDRLGLSYNDFDGTLPAEIGALTKLEQLELSRARRGGLTGGLPALDQLPALAVLGLSHNNFQGSIPPSFISGVSDKGHNIKVSLSYNHLTGGVPISLDAFSSMELELEANMIEDLPSLFCDNKFWMEGNVGQANFGCNAILCPPGTWNKNGKESPQFLCEPCEINEFYGATECGSSTSDSSGTTDDQMDDSTTSGTSSSPQSQPQTEEEILDMLYAATNGDSWTAKHDGWTVPGTPVCKREGITCNDGGKVEAVRLNKFGLTGQIPTEIFQLSSNRVLGFTDNNVDISFQGIEQSVSLETFLMSNTKLKSLEGIQHAPPSLKAMHIARNDIDGTFPKGLLSLKGLHKLFLNQNKITGPIPTELASISTLEELRLWDNRMTGHIPSELGMLSMLKDLDINSNLFSGPLPTTLSQLEVIMSIDFSNQRGANKLSGPLLPFASSAKLKLYNASMNEFAGTIPSNMISLVETTARVTVDLSDNKLSGGVPSQLGSFGSLNLFLISNMIDSLPASLCANENWMNGDVGSLKTCDAILCPPGTFAALGRASPGEGCVDCPEGESSIYYGSTTCSNHAEANERDILTNFFERLDGESWINKYNWDTGSSVCLFAGVSCNDDGSVVELKLASNQIVGTKDDIEAVSQIFQLPNLQVLDLKGNSIYLDFEKISFSPSLQSVRVSGTGLSSFKGISKAVNLRRLHATDNMLNGTLPDEIFDLTNLRSLYLSFNAFEGSIPSKISKLSNLQEFYMYGNNIAGSLPTEIGQLQNLRELVLARNFITGAVPTEVSSLSQLEQLSLYDQQGSDRIGGPLPTFAQAPNLWFFDVSNCALSGTIPKSFMENSIHKNATVTLVLKNNELSGTLPSSLKQFDALDIDLTGNKIEGIDDDLCKKSGWMKGEVGLVGSCDAILCPSGMYNEHGRQKSLESPCQSCKDLETVAYMGQAQCESFEGERGALNLLYSSAGGVTWQSKDKWTTSIPICSWEGIECGDGTSEDDTGVTAINLEKNNLSGSFPTALWSLPSLKTLLLSGNNDLSISFEGLSNAAKLEVLQISSTKIDSVSGISQASNLKELFIDENGLTGTFPLELMELHATLQKLRFSANYFYGSIPSEIVKMTMLSEFHAANNEFYSTIPSELAQLTKLQSVALNENLFYGELPSELSNMPQLQIFSVRRERKSGPKLSGSIPTFNQNPSLTVLFLDGNEFTGQIPDSFLSSSPSVYLVDLKNNSLSGTVPQSLDNLKELDIRLEGNQITGLSDSFCDNSDWMGGNVGRLKSCDAIMCGPGTANPNGRALSSPDECKVCQDSKAAPFYGSRSCEPVLTEKEILMKLYDACNGAQWKISKNWNTNVDICDWHGIGCKDGHVILINLGANNLSGTPPAELFDLPKLEILWLNSNPIQFSFDHIGRAKSLMDLRVDETSLTKLAGVGDAVFLTSLHIGFNPIGGPFPQELLLLKNIRTLSMDSNGFTGVIPDLSGLEFLRTLRLSNNNFEGPLPAFDGMHILNILDLARNKITGRIPNNFLERVGRRLNLQIDLSNNAITGTIPGSLSGFDDLSLYLRGNMISDIPEVLCAKSNWMGGEVGKFGCNAILCAPETSNFDGRHSSRSLGCASCPEAKDFYGQAVCIGNRSAATARRGLTLLTGLAFAATGFLLFY